MTRKPRSIVIFEPPQTHEEQLLARKVKQKIKQIGHIALVSSLAEFQSFHETIEDIFIVSRMSLLPHLDDSALITEAIRLRKTRVLFLQEDIPGKFFPQLLNSGILRTFKNFLLLDKNDFEIPGRIIRAWEAGKQHELLARAAVNLHGDLVVVDCALRKFEINLYETFKTFAEVPSEELEHFETSPGGLHWSNHDIDISFESIRYMSDPDFRARSNAKSFQHNKRFGAAVKALRRKHLLAQDDIEGLSDRTIRAIEKGEAHPNVVTLKKLAAAHDLTFEKYFEELGQFLQKR